MVAASWKARKLNEILPPLQEEFEAALQRGVVLELAPGASTELLEELLAGARAETQA